MADAMTPGAGADIHPLGWDRGWAAAFEPFAVDGRRPARVVAVHRETSIVREGSILEDRSAVVSGRFRFDVVVASDYPAVGDWVALESDETATDADGHAVIAAVLPRRSAFRRRAHDSSRRREASLADDQVIAANVDIAFLVAGLDGDFNLRRLERYLAVALASGVTPVVVLNKADVAEDLDVRRAGVESIAPGVPLLVLSARTGDHLADLAAYLVPGHTAVFLGSSGVGKSTLVNALLGEQRQATGEVRGSDSRGRHTTTHRELFAVQGGALLIDTPGIRSLEVAGADDGVDDAFDDVVELAATCRFSDCAHDGEPGCAVRAAITDGRLTEARLASHRKLEREAAHAVRRGDPRLLVEERKRTKSIHKAVDRQMRTKYGEDR